jgi:hypothetical protein
MTGTENTESLIYKQIPKVMAEIGAIGKDRKNLQQNYQFRGIDDIYNACNAVLAEHEVFAVPKVLDIKREERSTKSGGLLIYTILTVSYTFFAADGSNVECITIGEAMDSADKSCNKCMSAAHKYALIQVFAIPTVESKDTEGQSHFVAPRASAAADTGAQSASDGAQSAPNGQYISPVEAAELEDFVKSCGMNIAAFLKTFSAHSFSEFPKSQLHAASKMLAKRQP